MIMRYVKTTCMEIWKYNIEVLNKNDINASGWIKKSNHLFV